MKNKINYMLYSNDTNESLGYGDIEYISEILSDIITDGNPEDVDIRPTQASVLKALREYNLKHSYSINLFQHLE